MLPTSANVLIILHKWNMSDCWKYPTFKYADQSDHAKEICMFMQIMQRGPLNMTWVFWYKEFEPNTLDVAAIIFFFIYFFKKSQFKKFLKWSVWLKGASTAKFFWERYWGFANVVTDRNLLLTRMGKMLNVVFLCQKCKAKFCKGNRMIFLVQSGLSVQEFPEPVDESH